MEALSSRWAAIHQATIPLVRRLAAPSTGSTASAAHRRLPPGVLDSEVLARAIAFEASVRLAPVVELDTHLVQFEAILDEMHALCRAARVDASNIPLTRACDRGANGLTLSAVDRALIAAAPLRAYEAELSLKRSILGALRTHDPPPAARVQSLLVAWECQPMLLPAEALSFDGMEQESETDEWASLHEQTASQPAPPPPPSEAGAVAARRAAAGIT